MKTHAHNRYDVIVVGVGSVGACVCYQLAKRGARVLGIDRFSIPNAEASYGGESRVFRTAYFEHPDYVPLLRRARELWFELERELQESLYIETGGLYIGPRESTAIDLIPGTLRAAQEHQLPVIEFEHDELRRRYPQFNVPDNYIGVFEPHAGVLLSQRIVTAAARLAKSNGVVLNEHEPVQHWMCDAQGVAVTTNRGTYYADKLVICAGAWSSPLLPDVQKYLSVTRQVVAWFEPKDITPFRPDKFPIFGIDDRRPMMHYGFPSLSHMTGCAPGVKLAHHCAGSPASPNTLDRNPMPEELKSIRAMADTYLPSLAENPIAARVCMYTNSPDGHFMVDTYPGSDRVIYCAGLSGHGFKFATVLAEALADVAQVGETDLPIAFLSAQRFRK